MTVRTPTATDPSHGDGRRDHTVVVGVDGSSGSRRALLAAARSARRRGATLQVIMACEPPDWVGVWGSGPAAGVPWPERAEIERRAFELTQGMVGDVLAQVRREDGEAPDADVQARPGRPADVLLDAARHADELVVGHRGRGAVASRLLGSVGVACVLRAPCPVTVVPDTRTATTSADERAGTSPTR